MFVLGVLVGRGTAPVRFDIQNIENEIKSLVSKEEKQELDELQTVMNTVYEDEGVRFHEALKDTEEEAGLSNIEPFESDASGDKKPQTEIKPKTFISKPRKVDKTQKKPPAASHYTVSGNDSVTERKAGDASAATPVLKSDAQTADRPEIDEPSDIASITEDSGKFIIQTASFKNLEDAQSEVQRLIRKGYPAFRTLAKIPERGIWHRVRIGNFSEKKNAEAVLERLKNDNINGMVIQLD